ncbi:SWIM zinc finger family protein [Paenibacillus oryzisoli]|uniref:SWIM zinc finger family protein n=1 Tax=Paenibacillus oryzisoli TaxID=1850517 RepID=UPI003D28975A
MKLSRIEAEIAPVILERGEAYRDEGRVQYVEEVRPGVYEAQVDGSEDYYIEIRLKNGSEVVGTSCDCPFDGPICKHVAAVLLELRDELADEAAQSASVGQTRPKVINLADELGRLSKDELVNLLLQFADDMNEVQQRLLLKFQDAGSDAAMKQYQKIIRTSIKKNADRHGFVSYRQVDDAVEGAKMVLDKADEEMEEGRFISAVLIILCVIQELLDLQQSCDDSDGTIGWLVESGLETISQAAEQVSVGEHEERLALLAKLLEASALEGLDDWSEWRLPLLQASSVLIQTAEERNAWDNQVTLLEEREQRNSSYSSYWNESVADLRHDVIRQWDGEEAASSYLQSLLHMSGFRKKAIEQALAKQQWDAARKLIEEGEIADTKAGYPGRVTEWRKFRYQLYRLTHQIDEQRKLAEEFVLSGEYDFYLDLQKLYTEEEWPVVNERILTVLDQPKARFWKEEALYLRLLKEQRDTKRLLTYVRGNPSRIAELSSYLLEEHKADVHQLFAEYIEREAGQATNRSAYKKVCDIIRQLVKADGNEQALAIVVKLRTTYPNRPAFLDELQQVKVRG